MLGTPDLPVAGGTTYRGKHEVVRLRICPLSHRRYQTLSGHLPVEPSRNGCDDTAAYAGSAAIALVASPYLSDDLTHGS